MSQNAYGDSSLIQSVQDFEAAHENQEAGGNGARVFPAWQRVLSLLQREIDPQIYSAYFEPLKCVALNDQYTEIIISAPSRFLCNHVERNFRDKISEVLRRETNVSNLSVRFQVDTATNVNGSVRGPSPYVVVKRVIAQQQQQQVTQKTWQDEINAGLNPKYTFTSFVVGNSNQFCHAAAQRVAEEPGQSYNPLFIYGGVGLGKTHLLHAIGNFVLLNRPGAKVLYLSSESFTNELIQSLRNAKMEEFKNRLRNIDVLLIDDIQFMCGKERTQEEFFHTFNALYNAKRQIVITSDKIPNEIPGMEERLQTRFSWGLTADLQAPDFETRVAILKRKAALDGVELPEDVAHLIADRISSNVRELEGALTRLHAVSSLQRVAISMEQAQSALRPLLQPKTVHLTIDDIKKAVAQQFGLKVSDIISKRRTKNLSFPRHIAMYLCRKHTTCSYPEIGSEFGGRDHSSVIHAANVVSVKVSNDQKVKSLVVEIEKRLFG